MVRLRVLVYNTYLLRALSLRLGPWRLDIGAKPDWAERAEGIGAAVAGRHDVLALCEVFADSERDTIARRWAEAADWPAGTLPHVVDGPAGGVLWRQRRPVGQPPAGHAPADHPRPAKWPLAGQSSGLRTLVDPTGPARVTRSEVHVFEARGQRRVDADALANKGVLLTELDVGLPGRLELVTSHLLAGGGLWPRERGREQTWAGHRAAQVAEIVAFLRRAHRPGNVLALGGDLNIVASEPGRHSPEYENLVTAVGELGLVDQWPVHGTGPGWTSDLASLEHHLGPIDPSRPDRFLDRVDPPRVTTPAGRSGERIDYLFLQAPQPDHQVRVTVNAMHRLPFPRSGPSGPHRRLDWLSDHVGLGVELDLDQA